LGTCQWQRLMARSVHHFSTASFEKTCFVRRMTFTQQSQMRDTRFMRRAAHNHLVLASRSSPSDQGVVAQRCRRANPGTVLPSAAKSKLRNILHVSTYFSIFCRPRRPFSKTKPHNINNLRGNGSKKLHSSVPVLAHLSHYPPIFYPQVTAAQYFAGRRARLKTTNPFI